MKTFLAADGTRKPRPAWVPVATGVLVSLAAVGAIGMSFHPALFLLAVIVLIPLVYISNYWRS